MPLDNFGIYNFNREDIKLLIRTKNQNKLDAFLAEKYKSISMARQLLLKP